MDIIWCRLATFFFIAKRLGESVTSLFLCLIIPVTLVLAEIGVFLASYIFFWTIATAPYFTIALSIFSIIDPSFAPHASSIVMIQIFCPLLISCLPTISLMISVLIGGAALITFLAVTIPCAVVAVLIIETGNWIASAIVLVAILQCALRFFAAAEPAPSIQLEDKVEHTRCIQLLELVLEFHLAPYIIRFDWVPKGRAV